MLLADIKYFFYSKYIKKITLHTIIMYLFLVYYISLFWNDTHGIYSFFKDKKIPFINLLKQKSIKLNLYSSSNLSDISDTRSILSRKNNTEILSFSGFDNRTCISDDLILIQNITKWFKVKSIINELENPHISTFQKLNRITEWQQENSDESIYVPNLFGGGLIKDW
jgi:hypothetical protein